MIGALEKGRNYRQDADRVIASQDKKSKHPRSALLMAPAEDGKPHSTTWQFNNTTVKVE